MAYPARAVVYLFWGSRSLQEALASQELARGKLDLPTIAITDDLTAPGVPTGHFSQVVVRPGRFESNLDKSDLYRYLPHAFDSFLFLDTDTAVVDDVSYGFEKAERYGMAAAMAPHYSLDYFWGFNRVMELHGTSCRGQLQYNSGVLFFRRCPEVTAVFELWSSLCRTLGPPLDFYRDQPFLSLAMETLGFNPFTLSPSYNYRGIGELASGTIRIWHSRAPVPAHVNTIGAAPFRRVLAGTGIDRG